MKVTGIVAEYNPFHNGHKYQIQRAKKLTGADYVVVAMSGNFTQRGTPAIMNKYDRAKMALLNGADLVLELPYCYACSSAEFFAKGAMSLFDKLSVVDSICFGSECGNINTLITIAEILANEPEDYKKELRLKLQKGYSFPAARSSALHVALPEFATHSTVLSSPNNILGVEYIKALFKLKSKIAPYTIERVGSGYHDYKLSKNFSSAIAIRQALMSESSLDNIKTQMPENCYEILKESFGKKTPVFQDDFTVLLKYKMLLSEENAYWKYADISEDLSNKMSKQLFHSTDVTSLCEQLKTKDLTHSRITRSLFHILLDLTQKDFDTYLKEGTVFYGRVLGFGKEAAPLLGEIKKHSSIPLITKVSEGENLLSGVGLMQFQKDVQTAHIYEAVAATKFGREMKHEYQREIIKC